jgi:uncharacterized membrane protein YraQ (UPF0718 family)
MLEIFQSLWAYLLISAPYLLVGLMLAGMFHEFMPLGKVKSWLGGKSFSSVIRAAFVGIPLPLCSCSVIPTAVEIKKSGANNGATSAFLIATPESGVDSIALTYALIDLPMTIIRPIAAFCSAFFAGALQLFFNEEQSSEAQPQEETKSCCAKTNAQNSEQQTQQEQSRIIKAISYGLGDLLNDIAGWLSIGIIVGALINFIVPADFFLQYGQNMGRFMILLIGIPLYICATASTPIAVSLMLKGLSPGSALLLLLVGPATNISNIAVLSKYIGKKGVMINIFSIAFVALAFSFLTDWLYESFFSVNLNQHLSYHEHTGHWWQIVSAVLLSVLLIKGVYQENIKPRLKSSGEKHCH